MRGSSPVDFQKKLILLKINGKRYYIEKNAMSELIIVQLVGFLVVEPVHPGSSPQLSTDACIFLDLFQDLTAL
jgi:hypothetical protein